MRMKLEFLGTLALLLLATLSCNKEKSVFDIRVGDNFTLNFDQCKTTTSNDLEVCFVGLEDDRCPCDAVCIWEGEIWVELLLSLDSNPYAVKLSTSSRNRQKDTLGNYVISLEGVTAPECPKPSPNEKKYTIEVLVDEL